MTEKQRDLLLIAIRELQMKIENYPDNLLVSDFQEYYGMEITSAQDIMTELEVIAKEIEEGLNNG